MPLEGSVFMWLFGEEFNICATFPEELIIRDMELSKDQMAFLLEIIRTRVNRSVEPKVELRGLALARYASKADGVTLKKLGIHRAKRLAPDVIVATGRKGVKALAQMKYIYNFGSPCTLGPKKKQKLNDNKLSWRCAK